MEKNDVITLSSDDENESIHSPVKKILISKTPSVLKPLTPKRIQFCVPRKKKEQYKPNIPTVPRVSKISVKKPIETPKKSSPEVVVIEEGVEKGNTSTKNKTNESIKKHSHSEIIDIDDLNENETSNIIKTDSKIRTTENNTTELTLKPGTSESIFKTTEVESKEKKIEEENVKEKQMEVEKEKKTEEENSEEYKCSHNLRYFTEFVEVCGSLETIKQDRIRLTKKLMKKYGEADEKYVKSQEFINLILKYKDKLNKSNMYLIAKEITDELSFRKRVCVNVEPPKEEQKSDNEDSHGSDTVQTNNTTDDKKRDRFINKVIKKLDKLGKKIRELEEQEVDLSDEEESSYVLLQRYRERFCQIYTKLCKFTNQVPDADRVYNRKICFSESKYPAINKCIENWLNKTKRFPDFSDIMKLLESQSSELNLPSNRDSLRLIAIELFQQVGAMLQRRRRYDLWDSCCGFLGDADDPAASDPALEAILKSNFENRVKKEDNIFQYYVDRQEREKLVAEEVPDGETSYSPVDTDNEDDKEIEEIENSINKKLDAAIRNTERNDHYSSNEKQKTDQNDDPDQSKESKNNFQNCKSLKWRSDERKKDENDIMDEKNGNENDLETEKKEDSDLELIDVKSIPQSKALKRFVIVEKEQPTKKKCFITSETSTNKIDVLEVNDDTDGVEKSKVFNVHCCQIINDYVFDDLNQRKKDWGEGRVFRDLTNVKRLFQVNGKKRKMSDICSPYFFYKGFGEFKKPSWKKKFKISYKLVTPKDQKCALNHENKPGRVLNSQSARHEKDVQNNSENVGRNIFSSHGNGNEEDNNGDESRKNGKTDVSDNQYEEEDEDIEEEDVEEGDDDSQPNEHSLSNQKTELIKENEKVQYSYPQESGEISESSIEKSEELEDETFIPNKRSVIKFCRGTNKPKAPSIMEEICYSQYQIMDTTERLEENKNKYEVEKDNWKIEIPKPLRDIGNENESEMTGAVVNYNEEEGDSDGEKETLNIVCEDRIQNDTKIEITKGVMGYNEEEPYSDEENGIEMTETVIDYNEEEVEPVNYHEEAVPVIGYHEREAERPVDYHEEVEHPMDYHEEEADPPVDYHGEAELPMGYNEEEETEPPVDYHVEAEPAMDYHEEEAELAMDYHEEEEAEDYHEGAKRTADHHEGAECAMDYRDGAGAAGDYHGVTVPPVDYHEATEPTGDYHEATEPTGDYHEATEPAGDYHGAAVPPVDYHEATEPAVDYHEAAEPPVDYHEAAEPPVDYHEAAEPPVEYHEAAEPPVDYHEPAKRPVDYHEEAPNTDGENNKVILYEDNIPPIQNENAVGITETVIDYNEDPDSDEEKNKLKIVYEEHVEDIHYPNRETTETSEVVSEEGKDNFQTPDIQLYGDKTELKEEGTTDLIGIKSVFEGDKDNVVIETENTQKDNKIEEKEKGIESDIQGMNSSTIVNVIQPKMTPGILKIDDGKIKVTPVSESTQFKTGMRTYSRGPRIQNKSEILRHYAKTPQSKYKEAQPPRNDGTIPLPVPKPVRRRRSTNYKTVDKLKKPPIPDLIDLEKDHESKVGTLKVKNFKSLERVKSKVENKPTATIMKPNVETVRRETIELKPSTIRKLLQIDSGGQKPQKKNTTASDEERVKRFLLHSPSSISITPPRKLNTPKPPSQAALQALAALRNLKGISATIVRGGKPMSDGDMGLPESSYSKNFSQAASPSKRSRNDVPIISNVQSLDCTTPKIVTVQGNVAGFETSWAETSKSQYNPNPIRISKVWGSSSNPSPNSESKTPVCTPRQPHSRPSNNVARKKTAKKPVEYVVLD